MGSSEVVIEGIHYETKNHRELLLKKGISKKLKK